MRAILVVAGTALVLAGCMSSGTKVDERQLTGFERGVTTEDQVIAKLGKPDTRERLDDGTRIDKYTYVHASPKAVNFVPVVGLFAGGANGKSTTVRFTFDQNGLLKSYSTEVSNVDVRTGLANQK
jgi:outer membrane protein assembly factor BamE (lipoprotein component of BamABCDE complex)